MIKVSVIVPIYNVEPYLRRCLDSLVNQTLKDIEIICINDCSPDKSLAIVKEYAQKDSRIKIINFKKNQGVSAARNSGMKIAKGEYIGFCDTDDYVDLDFYEKLYALTKNKDADIVKGNVKVLDSNNKAETIAFDYRLQKLKYSFTWGFWSCIYKKKMLIEHSVNFPTTKVINGGDAVFLNHAIIASKRMLFLNDSYYHYIRREDSLDSMFFSKKKFHSVLVCLTLIFNRLNNSKISKAHYCHCYAIWFTHTIYLAYRISDTDVNKEFTKFIIKFHKKCKFPDKLDLPEYIAAIATALKNQNENELVWVLKNKVKVNNYSYPFINIKQSTLRNRKLYIWGAGDDGVRVKKQCESYGWKITGFLDSNKNVKEYNGYKVVLPEQILNKPKKDFFIIISSRKYETEIANICWNAKLEIEQDFWMPMLSSFKPWGMGILKGISVEKTKLREKLRTNYKEIDFTDIEFYNENILLNVEKYLLGKVEGTDYDKSEMSHQDRAFLNGIIRKIKPKVIVEIGLAAGGSSCVILNAIRDMDNAKLYSFDYNTIWYRDKGKKNGRKTGFLVNQIVPELVSKWELYTGGVPCKHLNNLPDEGVDICLIDTAHYNPGEHLNILEILPFMKKNGIVIYHDTAYHSLINATGTTNIVSINTLNGKRILLRQTMDLPNIGAIILDENIGDMLFPLFSNLSLPWSYKISEDDFVEMFKHFSKYYSKHLVQIYVYYCYFYMNGGLQNKEYASEIAEKVSKEFYKEKLRVPEYVNFDNQKFAYLHGAQMDVAEADIISEDDIWMDDKHIVWKAEKFHGFPNFYPIYKYKSWYSFSILPLIAIKKSLKINKNFLNNFEDDTNYYYSGVETIDNDIFRIGGPVKFTTELKESSAVARSISQALLADIAAIEKRYPGYVNVILVGGKDSLNLLLLPWKNPVLVVSAQPNFPLVQKFILENQLPWNVEELLDIEAAFIHKQETLVNAGFMSLVHARWGIHLIDISDRFQRKAIFWLGLLADAFLTPYWKTCFRNHSQSSVPQTPQDFGEALWWRCAMWQGTHTAFMRTLTGCLTLSAYHGPNMREILPRIDLESAITDDIRPLIGEILGRRTIKYPLINPGPPISLFRRYLGNPSRFISEISRFHLLEILE